MTAPLHLSLFLEMYDTSIFGAFLTGTIKILNVCFFVCLASFWNIEGGGKKALFCRYCKKMVQIITDEND